jgi:hypothetical protein
MTASNTFNRAPLIAACGSAVAAAVVFGAAGYVLLFVVDEWAAKVGGVASLIVAMFSAVGGYDIARKLPVGEGA